MTARKILMTGATGHVARPVAELLAEHDEVWCIGRFTNPEVRDALVGKGIRTIRWDLRDDDLGDIPTDFTHVMHAAVDRGSGQKFEDAIAVNSVATGRLMSHCRNAEAFLYVSTGVLYARHDPAHLYAETDPLGTHLDWLPTYPVGKLAAEGTVRAYAATLRLPTTIARLNSSYGPYGHGGIPILFLRQLLSGEPIAVPRHGQDVFSPIHTDDVARQTPMLWDVAAVPATVVNWGGDDTVGISDLMRYVCELTGVPMHIALSDVTRATLAFDNTRRRRLIGDCKINWRDGIARTVEAHFPDGVRTHEASA